MSNDEPADACLALLLDGPMQSWGFESRFTRRTTHAFPTRCGVMGIVAAAMGIDKHATHETDALARLAKLQMTVLRLPKRRGTGPLPMRRLSDYHTIGGGYDKRTEAMKKPRAASGAGLETVLSERHYLLDSRFGILLEEKRELLEPVAAGLRDPRWGVWLGRKCCIPATPLLVGIADSRLDAFRLILERTGYPVEATLECFDHVIEGADAEGLDAEWLNDAPISYGAPIGERHAPRRVRLISQTMELPAQP